MKQRIFQFLMCVMAICLLGVLAYVLANPEIVMDQQNRNRTCSVSFDSKAPIQSEMDSTHLKRTDFSRSGHKEK